MIKTLGASASVIALSCLPALAQSESGVCGQPSILTQPIGETIAPGFDDLTVMMQPERSEPSYVEFEVTEPTDITLETLARDNDALLTLFDSNGDMIMYDDDGTGSLDARLSATLQPGNYCAQVRLIATSVPVASPRIILLGYEGLPPDPNAADNRAVAAMCETAPVLSDDMTGAGTQTARGMVTRQSAAGAPFRFSVSDQTDLQIDATSDAIDTVLKVVNSEGATLYENDDSDEMRGTDSRVRSTFAPGDYCVIVSPFDSDEGAFQISATALGGETDTTSNEGTAPVDPSNLSVPQDGDGTQIEALGALADEELGTQTFSDDETLWATFEVEEDRGVTVEGLSVTSGFNLALFAEDGTQIQTVPSSGSVSSATIETELPAGRYFVAMTDAETTSGMKMRQVKVRPN
ncbi:PPC domain-containing protein [Falsirhodobacter sp. alg1]|uniref:PPC domain-containing protein n=1 Tax=Falsirhodobacter sp. alg1 TaxID=1472418 RepID=UPI0005F06653|nr:PPC domain-containing protein [Falsirhodobacter sp. alg1]